MSLTGYCNSAYIKNRFYSIYRFGVVIFFFLVLFLILQKTVENMSKSILTKNNKSSLRRQKLSLRLNIAVFFDFQSQFYLISSSFWGKIYSKWEENFSMRFSVSPEVVLLGLFFSKWQSEILWVFTINSRNCKWCLANWDWHSSYCAQLYGRPNFGKWIYICICFS